MIRFGRDLATEAGMAGKDISVKKYVVRLSAGEREHMQALIRKGKSPAKRLLKARILLKADVSEAGEGWSDSWIIQALDTSASMIYRVRKQLVEEGFEAVLSRKRRMTPPVAAIFDGEKEAKLIALACSKPTEGARPLDVAPAGEQGRGTRHCRARKRLNDRTHTQKNCLKPHRRQCWVIPPKANSAFVAAMEDVLAVYTRRTISTSTARRHSTKPFRPPKPDGWSSASNGTTRLSTAVGSISRNPNSVSSPLNVSIAASQTNRPSSRKSPLGNTTEMPITQRQTGNSQPNPLECQTQVPIPFDLA